MPSIARNGGRSDATVVDAADDDEVPDGVRVVCIRPHAIPESLGVSNVADAFGGMAERAGTSADKWLAGLAAQGTLLGRLPTTGDVAEYAAFAASDRARTMTGAIANLSAGSIVDEP